MKAKVGAVLTSVILLAGSATAVPVDYTFDVTAGSLDIVVPLFGAWTSDMDGTFAIRIDDGEGHIGASDSVLLLEADLFNTDAMIEGFPPALTFTIEPGSARLLDFAPAGSAHVAPGGDAVIQTDVYAEVTMMVTGAIETIVTTQAWAGGPSEVSLTLTESATTSDTVTAGLNGDFLWTILLPTTGDSWLTVTLDLIIDVEGTAHVVPALPLTGLATLGLAGAGLLLRRRGS